jgi:nucleoside-diphosphate-sugar epimerase
MCRSWVIGAGGLLGSYLKFNLQDQGFEVFTPSKAFSWVDSKILLQEMSESLNAFALTIPPGKNWLICWAAGTGNMHSSKEELKTETLILREFIDLISHSSLDLNYGAFQFTSSAGAVYADSNDQVVTEFSSFAPINPYGEEKINQEKIVEEMTQLCPNFTILITRITTLFGIRKKKMTNQGLLAHISFNLIRKIPIHIYVPLETRRDYIHADDASKWIIAAFKKITKKGGAHIKIIASEQLHSISEVLEIFKQESKSSIDVNFNEIGSTGFYKKDIKFKSVTLPNEAKSVGYNLTAGVQELLAYEKGLL